MVGGALLDQTFESPIQREELCRITPRRRALQLPCTEILPKNVSLQSHSFAGVRAHDGEIIDAYPRDAETLLLKIADHIRTAGNHAGPGLVFETIRNQLANIRLWRLAKTFGLGGEFGHMSGQRIPASKIWWI